MSSKSHNNFTFVFEMPERNSFPKQYYLNTAYLQESTNANEYPINNMQ